MTRELVFSHTEYPGHREIAPDVYWLQECLVREPAEGTGGLPIHGSDNAYLLSGEETLLFDTFSPAGTDAILSQLDELLAGSPLHYLVVSHPEPNHAGNATKLLRAHPETTLVVPEYGNEHHLYHIDRYEEVRYVGHGDQLSVGSFDISFTRPYFLDHAMHIWMYEATASILFTVDWMGFRHGTECLEYADFFPAQQIQRGMEEFMAIALAWLQFADMERVSAAVDRLRANYSPSIIAPAHGQVIREQSLEWIEAAVDAMATVSEQPIDPAGWPRRAPNPSVGGSSD